MKLQIHMHLQFITSILMLSLAGCGGGSGGSSSNGGTTVPPGIDNSWLQFTPSSIDVTQYQGESVSITVNAKANKTFSQTFNVGIIDTSGTIEPNAQLQAVTPYEYNAKLTTAKSLAVGIHTASLEIRLCEDIPTVCAKPIPGSPWKLPLKVTVQPQTNVSTLTKVSGLGAWTHFQGNAQHSGYVPATFDPANFSRRLTWEPPSSANIPSSFPDLSIADGQIFVVTSPPFQGMATLWAINEATGTTNWSKQLSATKGGITPVVTQGKVVLTISDSTGSSLQYFDQRDGTLLRKVAISGPRDSSASNPSSPVVVSNSMFVAKGDDYGFAGYDLVGGTQIWEVATSDRLGSFTMAPAADSQYVYRAKEPNHLGAYRVTDGTLAYSVGNFQHIDFQNVTPVLSGTGMAFLVNDRWYGGRVTMGAVDLNQRAATWMAHSIDSMPVASPTAVYAIQTGSLVAFDPKSGAQLWATSLPNISIKPSLLVTENLIFVSSGDLSRPPVTQAIDLKTHKIVWSHSQGGRLALSDRGVLYIQMPDRPRIAAINLR